MLSPRISVALVGVILAVGPPVDGTNTLAVFEQPLASVTVTI